MYVQHKPERNQLALWVAAGGPIAPWCKKFGIPKGTAYHWCKQDSFKRMVQEYRRRAVDRAVGTMVKGLGKAVAKVVELIEKGETDRVKLAAGKALVDKFIAMQSHAELMAELNRLDERLRAQEKRRASGHPKAGKAARPS